MLPAHTAKATSAACAASRTSTSPASASLAHAGRTLQMDAKGRRRRRAWVRSKGSGATHQTSSQPRPPGYSTPASPVPQLHGHSLGRLLQHVSDQLGRLALDCRGASEGQSSAVGTPVLAPSTSTPLQRLCSPLPSHQLYGSAAISSASTTIPSSTTHLWGSCGPAPPPPPLPHQPA